jgi:hypothetical protein
LLEAAHETIRESKAKGLKMYITEPRALYRYQKGPGYSKNTPRHFDIDPPIKSAEPPQI